MRLSIIFAAAFWVTACAEAPKGSGAPLALDPGLVWAERVSSTTVMIQGRLSINGEFTPDSLRDPNPETKQEGVRVHKVIRRVHSEVFDKQGVLVQTVAQRDAEASSGIFDDLGSAPVLSERVLVEHEGWLREFPVEPDDFTVWFNLDGNVTRGRALYPVAPRSGAYYTDDQGGTHRAAGRETLPAGSAERMEVQVPEPLVTWERFYEQCFYKSDTGRPLLLNADCREYLQERDGELTRVKMTNWVDGLLLLGGEIAVERLTIESVCCGETCVGLYSGGGMSGPYDLTCNGDNVSFEGMLRSDSVSAMVTRITSHENPLTPPTIEDAEVQP